MTTARVMRVISMTIARLIRMMKLMTVGFDEKDYTDDCSDVSEDNDYTHC